MSRLFRSVALIGTAFVLATSLPAQAASQFGNTACPGVRPGAQMQAPRGVIYTMGFLFKGVDAKKKTANYLTTVGNQVFQTFGTKMWAGNSGPRAYDGLGKPIGSFVYATHTETPDFSTFGVIKLDGKIKPNAQVCHFGGPTAAYTTVDVTPKTVEFYGNGFPIDQAFPARTALVSGTGDDNALAQALISPIDTGDLGAPFLVDGKALGYWDGGIGLGEGAGFVIARLGPRITQAQKALKLKLTLQTGRRL